MLLACSHLVIATENVVRLTRFIEAVFEVKPYFENDMFSEFVLKTGFRIAFFKPVGSSGNFFSANSRRDHCAFGVTVDDVDALFTRVGPLTADKETFGEVSVSGPPKSHPWGEKSFLLLDPDGNRWEVAQSPSPDGMLINKSDVR